MNTKEYNRKFLDDHEHLSALGVQIANQKEGTATLSLPFSDSICNPDSGVIHGGVIATLIDHAGGVAIRTTLENPGDVPHATTDLNVTYVRPGTGDLRADATVVRAGRTMGVVSIEVSEPSAGKENIVAVGRASIHLTRD